MLSQQLFCWFMMLNEPVGVRVSLCDVMAMFIDINGLFILIEILVTWPAPHPKYVAAGICQYSYWGKGHWL